MTGLSVKRADRLRAEDPPPPGGRPGTALAHARVPRLRPALPRWLDLLDVPLEDRKRLLRLVLRDHPSVRYVSHVHEHGVVFHEAVVDAGPGGQRGQGPVEPLRARQARAVVAEDQGPTRAGAGGRRLRAGRRRSPADLGSLLVATWEAEGWRYRGQGRQRPGRAVAGHPAARAGRAPTVGATRARRPDHAQGPLDGAAPGHPRGVHRVDTRWPPAPGVFLGREVGRDPRSVAREPVEHTGRVREPLPEDVADLADTGPRAAPSVAAESQLRPDLGPPLALELVRARTIGRAPRGRDRAELAALAALGDGGPWEVGGHAVNLTNLDKVLFPAAGFTKRDLVRYYTTIAPRPAALPARPPAQHWTAGRMASTGAPASGRSRSPRHAPAWVTRWDYPEAGPRPVAHLRRRRPRRHAGLAGQPGRHRPPPVDQPAPPSTGGPRTRSSTSTPGADTTWEELRDAGAALPHRARSTSACAASPRSPASAASRSGSRSQPRYTFDETRDWVGRALAGAWGRSCPDLVSWEWGKADRGGRARLDFTQNALNKTLVAPYAVRPVAAAAVSAPITWDELDDPDAATGRLGHPLDHPASGVEGGSLPRRAGGPPGAASALVTASSSRSGCPGDGQGRGRR